MIEYSRFVLDNGLVLLVNEDHDTQLVTVNTLFRVGSRNEDPAHTGFAHLFEHLMFGGTPNVPDYDAVVTSLSGDDNAFTNNDYTNYYVTAPAEHLERLIALEADRMKGLDFSPQVLSVQQQVVTEEYNQRYVDAPYADKWLLLRPLCYKVYPYRWTTIGADIKHVQQATVDDERAFFSRYYRPDNAIVAVAGNVETSVVVDLVKKYYGSITVSTPLDIPAFHQEPEQTESRRLVVERNVPYNAIYKAFLMCDHYSSDFFVYDLISDVLSNGKSSRMYLDLVKRRQLFLQADAYISGDMGPGLFVIGGYIADGVSFEQAEAALDEFLAAIASTPVEDYELQKVVNKYESQFAFSHYKAADRAQSLCYYEYLGNLDWVNNEPDNYKLVTPADLQRVASFCFQPNRANVLCYKKI